ASVYMHGGTATCSSVSRIWRMRGSVVVAATPCKQRFSNKLRLRGAGESEIATTFQSPGAAETDRRPDPRFYMSPRGRVLGSGLPLFVWCLRGISIRQTVLRRVQVARVTLAHRLSPLFPERGAKHVSATFDEDFYIPIHTHLCS